MLTEREIREEIEEHEGFINVYARKPSGRKDHASIALHEICIRTLRRVLQEEDSLMDDDLNLAGLELTALLNSLARVHAYYEAREKKMH